MYVPDSGVLRRSGPPLIAMSQESALASNHDGRHLANPDDDDTRTVQHASGADGVHHQGEAPLDARRTEQVAARRGTQQSGRQAEKDTQALAFSGRQARHGTQPEASASARLRVSRSSGLRNRMRMQSDV